MRDIVLVSHASVNKFEAEVVSELSPLHEAFAKQGVTARVAAWDDPAFDWSTAGVALLRTTWNYHRHVDAFVRWAGTVPQLLNPFSVVKWNAYKTYLRDLDARGVPVIATEWLTQDVALSEVLARRGWSEAVLKPVVSGGSFRTRKFAAHEAESVQPLLREILTAGTGAMLQPYFASVETHGERSLVFFAGRFSHAVKRFPPLLTGLHGGTRVEAAADELELAARAMTGLGPLAYARVDIARDAHGAARLMELELIEPSLFLDLAEGAADLLVAAVLDPR